MGIVKKSLGFVGKAVGYIANEAIRSSTGVDIKEEINKGKRETKEIDRDIAELERDKENFISREGEQAYQDKKAELERTKNDIIRAKAFSVKASLEGAINEKENEYRKQIEEFSDKQLLYLEERKETPDFLKKLVKEERQKRENRN